MPDFRGNLDKNNYSPQYVNQSTTGPNEDGQMQTWQNQPGLSDSSAQQLARWLGADLTQVSYNGGPYSQERPQYQLDFGTGNGHDAAMVSRNYQNSPATFNAQLQDELISDRSKPVAIQEMEARAAAGQGAKMLPPPPSPSVAPPPVHPVAPAPPPVTTPVIPPTPPVGPPVTPPVAPPSTGGGGTTVPGPTWPAPPPTTVPGPTWPTPPPTTVPGPTWPDAGPTTVPGPKWPTPTAPNRPGPIWQMPELPPPPTKPATVKTIPGSPGSYYIPPIYTGGFPAPIALTGQGGLLGTAQQRAALGLLGGGY